MPNQKTVVEYDITQPEKALRELGRHIRNVEKTAGKGFGDARKASQAFESGIRLVNPRAAELLTNVTRLSTSGFLPMVGAAGLAVGALGLVSLAFISLPDEIQKSEDRLKKFTGTLKLFTGATQALRGLDFAGVSSQFEESLRQLRRTQGSLRGQQAEVKEAQAVLQAKLAGQRDYYNELNDIARESADERENLEKRLANLQKKQFLTGLDSAPLGQQIEILKEAISSATKVGDFDAAEELLSKLQDIARTSGNSFASIQASEAQEKYVEALQKSVKAAKEQESQDKRNANSAKISVEDTEDRIAGLERLDKTITNLISTLRDKLAQTEADLQDALDLDSANEAVLQLNESMRLLLETFNTPFTNADKRIIGLKKGLSRATEGLGIQVSDVSVADQQAKINELTQRLGTVASVSKIGTPEAVRASVQLAQDILKDIAEIEKGGQFSSAFDVFVKRLKDGAGEAVKAGEQAAKIIESGRSPDQQIKLNSERTVQPLEDISNILEDINAKIEELQNGLRRSADQAERVSLGSDNIPGVAPTSVQQRAGAQSSPPTAAASTVNVSVSANVKGGIIDNETASSIVDIVNRGIRQGIIQFRTPA